jgi:hypothetical protein
MRLSALGSIMRMQIGTVGLLSPQGGCGLDEAR